jgi:glycosyltransferase involved in cell wall biosynthesis
MHDENRINQPCLAYLLSEYPHIRHAYLLREIRGLRKLGCTVATVAVRPDNRPADKCTSEEMEERASTFCIVNAGLGVILRAHLKTFFSRPIAWCAGLVRALSYGDLHPRRTLLAVYYFIEAVVAGSWITERGISHVHTHYASTVAWIMARVFPLEISMSIHGSGEFDDPRGFRLREKVDASRFVRSIGYFGRSQMMRAAPYDQWKKIEICRLGIDPALFPPRPFRDWPGPFEFLCVGGMASPRAFQFILQALAMAAPRDVILRFVGDGPDRPMLERLARELGIADRVVFDGWKHQNQLREIYARTDAFVFSSFAEGIPVVLMEAMAMGIPCIAPVIGGIPELIRDGVDGLLFAASDTGALALAISRLIEDPALCRSLGASAHARILESYDLNRNIEILAGIFKRWLPAVTHAAVQ